MRRHRRALEVDPVSQAATYCRQCRFMVAHKRSIQYHQGSRWMLGVQSSSTPRPDNPRQNGLAAMEPVPLWLARPGAALLAQSRELKGQRLMLSHLCRRLVLLAPAQQLPYWQHRPRERRRLRLRHLLGLAPQHLCALQVAVQADHIAHQVVVVLLQRLQRRTQQARNVGAVRRVQKHLLREPTPSRVSNTAVYGELFEVPARKLLL